MNPTLRKFLTWFGVAVFALGGAYLFVGRSSPEAPAPIASTQPALQNSALELEPQTPPVEVSRSDTNPYIDAQLISIGRLAQLYARRPGYVVCDDLLTDRRLVSVQLTFDSPADIERIVESYGYTVTKQGALTTFCGRRDPFNGSAVWIDPDRTSAGPLVSVEWRGKRRLYPIATLAAAVNLQLVVDGCTFTLVDQNGVTVRSLSDQACLARLSAPDSPAVQVPSVSPPIVLAKSDSTSASIK